MDKQIMAHLYASMVFNNKNDQTTDTLNMENRKWYLKRSKKSSEQ